MCVKRHETGRRSGVKRFLLAGGAAVLALSVSGCSAVNLTDFDFPSFGLLKKSPGNDVQTTSSVSPYREKNAEKLGMAQ